jgi:hypothetical protein
MSFLRLDFNFFVLATSMAWVTACSAFDVVKRLPGGSDDARSGAESTATDDQKNPDSTNVNSDNALCRSTYFGEKATDLRQFAIEESACPAPKPAGSYCFRWNFTGGNATPEAQANPDIRNIWMTLDQACGMYSRMARQ